MHRLLLVFLIYLGARKKQIGCLAQFTLDDLNIKKFLGGDIEIDILWFPIIQYPSIFGQYVISYPCDLNCQSFSAFLTPICRWRNEWTICQAGDELDWYRAKNSWGREESLTIFGTEETGTGYTILTGTRTKMHPDFSAMLVSDPIPCQEGDGQITFRYWTSPLVKLRACTRKPSSGKVYEWCSRDVTTGDPGPAIIVIPGSICYMFEIVIEARNFVFDSFGMQGGVTIIDDITYNATSINDCKRVPHIEPLIEFTEKTCKALQCDFDSGSCLDAIGGTGWKVVDDKVGNYHTGIRRKLEGRFVVARGPGTKSFTLTAFKLERRARLEFCFYVASRGAKLVVNLIQGENKTMLFRSEDMTNQPHDWLCDNVNLEIGEYDGVEFIAEKLTNEFSYLAVDQIGLTDPLTGKSACLKFDSPGIS